MINSIFQNIPFYDILKDLFSLYQKHKIKRFQSEMEAFIAKHSSEQEILTKIIIQGFIEDFKQKWYKKTNAFLRWYETKSIFFEFYPSLLTNTIMKLIGFKKVKKFSLKGYTIIKETSIFKRKQSEKIIIAIKEESSGNKFLYHYNLRKKFIEELSKFFDVILAKPTINNILQSQSFTYFKFINIIINLPINDLNLFLFPEASDLLSIADNLDTIDETPKNLAEEIIKLKDSVSHLNKKIDELKFLIVNNPKTSLLDKNDKKLLKVKDEREIIYEIMEKYNVDCFYHFNDPIVKSLTIKLKFNDRNAPDWLRELIKLPHLEILNLSDLFLTEIPEFLQDLPNLIYLDMRRNNVRKIPPFIITWPKIKEIDLRDNDINNSSQDIKKFKNMLIRL